MAKMVPDFCKSQSNGEEKLFESFRSDTLLENVTILHSLNIANHVRLPESEADFVCLIPNQGILVIEVKGHLRINFKDGKWYMGHDEPTTRGPLRQAKEAMYSIRDYLQRNGFEVSEIPMFYAAWFPNTTFDAPPSIEWETWQYLDSSHLANSGKWLLDTMSSAIMHLEDKVGAKTKAKYISTELLSQIEKRLRPNFECILSEKEIRQGRKQEMMKFVEDQFQVLDLLRDNPRFVVSGPAGTGKTLLALEQARRLKIKGLSPLVLCFNKNLSSSLSKENSDLKILTISKLISDLAVNNGQAIGTFDLNTVELTGPTQFEIPKKVDAIVIDEAQDIFTKRYIPWLDTILEGGIASGTWFAFGDFDSQRLYGVEDGRELVSEYTSYASGSLGTNCRNTKIIGEYASQVIPKAPKWSAFRRINNQVEPKIRFARPDEELHHLLDEAIAFFKNEKFSFDDIVVLSPNLISDPLVEFSNSEYCQKFAAYSANSVGKIRFSTIHGFKGLESPCVILIELYNLSGLKDSEALKYVALTRATDRLFIVSDPKTEKILEEYLNG